MGTRNLTAVMIDGAYKIAQYGQWDGYPSGQGLTALEFLRFMDRDAFMAKLRAVTHHDDASIKALNEQIKAERLGGHWQSRWPELSRDAGAKVLAIVAAADPGIKLKNSINFAGDSLFCEWAYVIDFDAGTFEVFKGFDQGKIEETDRFHPSKNPSQEVSNNGYSPVRLAKSWPLDQLPAEVRQHHNCNTCRRFIETYGQLVLIDEQGASHSLMWDEFSTPQPYFAAVRAMRLAVEASRVTGVFLAEAETWGTAETGDWTHLAVDATGFPQFISRSTVLTPGQAMAAKREDFHTLRRALEEFNSDTLAQAVLLLKQDALSRSEKVLGMAEWLLKVKEDRADKTHGAAQNLLWRAVATAPAGFCTPRSSMIGTLLEDLSAGMPLETVKARFADKMRPDQYQRPTAPPKAGNIAAAEKLVEQMGVAPALRRRFARLDEIEAVWRPKPPATVAVVGGVFGHLAAAAAKPARVTEAATVTMTWDKFSRTVLPDALSIEAYIPMRGAFYAFATASDPTAPPILQWDREERRNPFSVYTYASGSLAREWSMEDGKWAKVNAISLRPHQWFGGEMKHQQNDAIAILEGCRDARTPGLVLFPEILRSELHPIRATIEAHSHRTKMEGGEEASACGLRVIGAVLRVTSKAGVAIYQIDRWD